MKYFIALLFLSLSTCNCIEARRGTQVKDPLDAKDDFDLVYLFSIDQCKVYRFTDSGRYRYLTTCEGSTASSHQEQQGQTSVIRTEEIYTHVTNKNSLNKTKNNCK